MGIIGEHQGETTAEIKEKQLCSVTYDIFSMFASVSIILKSTLEDKPGSMISYIQLHALFNIQGNGDESTLDVAKPTNIEEDSSEKKKGENDGNGDESALDVAKGLKH